MRDPDALSSRDKVSPLGSKTIDGGEIRLGPVRVELLTATQDAQVVTLLGCLFAAAWRPAGRCVQPRAEASVNAAVVASGSAADWQDGCCGVPQGCASGGASRCARLYLVVRS